MYFKLDYLLGSDECMYHFGWQKYKALFGSSSSFQFVVYNDKVLIVMRVWTGVYRLVINGLIL